MRCAILGSGNIGTDLMIKLIKAREFDGPLELVALVGIDPASDGLARARGLGIEGPHEGPQWILDHADDYSWFISADPKMEKLWIFTREVPDEALKARLVRRAAELGYDVSRLEFPAQPPA